MPEQPAIPLGPDEHRLFRSQDAQVPAVRPDNVSDGNTARQRQIDELRAEHEDEFAKIEKLTPELGELLSSTVEPPREWLEER